MTMVFSYDTDAGMTMYGNVWRKANFVTEMIHDISVQFGRKAGYIERDW